LYPDDGRKKHFKTLVKIYETTRRHIPEDHSVMLCQLITLTRIMLISVKSYLSMKI